VAVVGLVRPCVRQGMQTLATLQRPRTRWRCADPLEEKVAVQFHAGS
jgi:hypothetical protein